MSEDVPAGRRINGFVLSPLMRDHTCDNYFIGLITWNFNVDMSYAALSEISLMGPDSVENHFCFVAYEAFGRSFVTQEY
ncbi:MAG TPA: hypothetical protein VKG25_16240 [Bryobacteraceae bacterium]|nr:hypothetical protein [Bryobacteraceae bacterium]